MRKKRVTGRQWLRRAAAVVLAAGCILTASGASRAAAEEAKETEPYAADNAGSGEMEESEFGESAFAGTENEDFAGGESSESIEAEDSESIGAEDSEAAEAEDSQAAETEVSEAAETEVSEAAGAESSEAAETKTVVFSEAETAEAAVTQDTKEAGPETVSSKSAYINPFYREVFTEGIQQTKTGLQQTKNDLQQTENDLQAVSGAEYTSLEAAAAEFRSLLADRVSGFTLYFAASDMLTDEQLYYLTALALDEDDSSASYEGDAIWVDFVGWNCTQEGYYEGNICHLAITFDVQYYTTSQQELTVRSAVKSAVASLGIAGASEFEKVKAIHDFVSSTVSYDYANLNNEANTLKYTAYAALVNKTAVCQGYASLFYRMCREAGLSARIIFGSSYGEAHSWNIVRVDGSYYNVDTTWDRYDTGAVGYDFFLKSESDFTDHVRSEDYQDSWFVGQYPVAAWSYTAVTSYRGRLCYVQNGIVNTSVTGMVLLNNVRYYLKNGVVDTSCNGLRKENGVWYYFNAGIVDTAFVGLTKYNGVWFFVRGGVIDSSYQGLTKFNGVWFYVKDGMVNKSYVGLVKFNGVWFYISNGMINRDFVGLTKFNGVWFYIQNGMINRDFVGLTKFNGVWFYIQNGMINRTYAGLTRFNGVLFYVRNGMPDSGFSGSVTYNGKLYQVVNGIGQ